MRQPTMTVVKCGRDSLDETADAKNNSVASKNKAY